MRWLRRLPSWLAIALVVGVLPSSSAATAIESHRVLGRLHDAVAFTVDDRGRIWYVEKTFGEVRVADPATGRRHVVWKIPDVDGSFAQGPLGIALAPAFPRRPFVYVYATRGIGGGLVDQILRLRMHDGRVATHRVIFSVAAHAGALHDGGRILFGPDGKLWVTVGDAGDEQGAQDLDSRRGKVLRLDPDGAPAPGNPWKHSRVWARGFRNPWGSDFDPVTGRLWLTDNGPECNDELDLIRAGHNYGWGPTWTCGGRSPHDTNRDGPNPVLPQRWYTPTIAPTGLAFCDGCGLGARAEGALFFGAYNTREIWRVRLTADRTGVRDQQVVLRANGRVLSLETDLNGRIYFSTGTAILRLVHG